MRAGGGSRGRFRLERLGVSGGNRTQSASGAARYASARAGSSFRDAVGRAGQRCCFVVAAVDRSLARPAWDWHRLFPVADSAWGLEPEAPLGNASRGSSPLLPTGAAGIRHAGRHAGGRAQQLQRPYVAPGLNVRSLNPARRGMARRQLIEDIQKNSPPRRSSPDGNVSLPTKPITTGSSARLSREKTPQLLSAARASVPSRNRFQMTRAV